MKILRKFSYFVLFLPCVFILFDEFTNSSSIQSLCLSALSSREQLFCQHTNTKCTRTYSDTQTHACKPNPSQTHTDPPLWAKTSAVWCSQIIDSSKQKVEGKTGISHADEIFTSCQPIQTNALLPSGTAQQQRELFHHNFPISKRIVQWGREAGWVTRTI